MITTLKSIFSTLKIPFAYSHFQKPVSPPYAVVIGAGQTTFGSDNTWSYRRNRYQLEYYFKLKDESKETAIENALLTNGLNYEKSEDAFIQSEGVFVIYYTI